MILSKEEELNSGLSVHAVEFWVLAAEFSHFLEDIRDKWLFRIMQNARMAKDDGWHSIEYSLPLPTTMTTRELHGSRWMKKNHAILEKSSPLSILISPESSSSTYPVFLKRNQEISNIIVIVMISNYSLVTVSFFSPSFPSFSDGWDYRVIFVINILSSRRRASPPCSSVTLEHTQLYLLFAHLPFSICSKLGWLALARVHEITSLAQTRQKEVWKIWSGDKSAG